MLPPSAPWRAPHAADAHNRPCTSSANQEGNRPAFVVFEVPYRQCLPATLLVVARPPECSFTTETTFLKPGANSHHLSKHVGHGNTHEQVFKYILCLWEKRAAIDRVVPRRLGSAPQDLRTPARHQGPAGRRHIRVHPDKYKGRGTRPLRRPDPHDGHLVSRHHPVLKCEI